MHRLSTADRSRKDVPLGGGKVDAGLIRHRDTPDSNGPPTEQLHRDDDVQCSSIVFSLHSPSSKATT